MTRQGTEAMLSSGQSRVPWDICCVGPGQGRWEPCGLPAPAPAPAQWAWKGSLFPLLPWDHIWAPSKAADIFYYHYYFTK